MAKEFSGQGFMKAAVKSLLVFGFDDLGLNRQVIRANPKNKASNCIAESLGFSFEGVEREAEKLYDHFSDVNAWSLLKVDKKIRS